jgi:4-carboxymuconolactone decarboxylase
MTLLSIRRDNDGQPLDRETLARIAPKLAELSQNVLFNDIWTREPLSPRERSLVTLGALTALGRVQQLPGISASPSKMA